MYSSESAWMFSSCAWRPSTSLSSDAVTSSRTTWMMLSPTIPSAALEVADAHADDPAVDLAQRRASRHCSMSRCIGTSSGSQWLAFIVR